MNSIHLDLQVAHYYPDEPILRYALREQNPRSWPAALKGPSNVGFFGSADAQLEIARQGLTRSGSSQPKFLPDYMPLIHAFHLAKVCKKIFFFISLVLLFISLATIGQLPTLVVNSLSFDVFYISITLGVEAAFIAFILRCKQRQIESHLLPHVLMPEANVLHRVRWLKTRSYCAALGLACLALAVFFLHSFVHLAPDSTHVVLFVLLSMAIVVALAAAVIDLKEMRLRRHFVTKLIRGGKLA